MLKNLFYFYVLSMAYSLPRTYTIEDVSTTNTSNSITNQVDPSECTCDVSYGVCDNFCCCDISCDASLITSWQSDGLCKYTNNPDITNLFLCADYKDQYMTSVNNVFNFGGTFFAKNNI